MQALSFMRIAELNWSRIGTNLEFAGVGPSLHPTAERVVGCLALQARNLLKCN